MDNESNMQEIVFNNQIFKSSVAIVYTPINKHL